MMGNDQYCLKWNNHWANLVRVFNSLRHSETFVDVTLACEGRHLKAHQLVLSASSPYFKELLVSHPDRHPIVILKDVKFAELQNLIQFIYNGEVSVEQQDLPSLLLTAKELQIRGLADNPAAWANSKQHITSTNSKPNDFLQPTNLTLRNSKSPSNPTTVLAPATPVPTPTPPLSSQTSRESSPVSKRRKLSSSDCALEIVLDKEDIPGPSGELEKEKMNGNLVDEKENLEPMVDINKKSEDSPFINNNKSDLVLISKDIDTPEVILEEEDAPIITANGTSSPCPPKMVPSPVEAPPISSTTPTPQMSFLQQALALGLQQPLHFLQNPPSVGSHQPPMSPTGYAKNILNFVDLLKAVGTNIPPGAIPPPPLINNSSGAILGRGLHSPNHHNNGIQERNPLSCHICARIMPTMQVLEEHVRIHEEEKPYKCEQCGQRYKYQSAFQRHQEQNHTAKLPGDKPYRCEVCGQCFKYHKSFIKHRANHDLLDNFLKTEPGEEGKGSTGTTTAIRALQESYLQRLLHPSFSMTEGTGGNNITIKEETKEEPPEDDLNYPTDAAKSPCMVSSTSVPTPLENGEIKEEEEDIDIDEIVPDVPGEGEDEDPDMGGQFFYCTFCKLTFKDPKAFEGHCRLSPQCSNGTLKEVSVGGDITVTSVPSSESPMGGSVPFSSGPPVMFSSPPGMLYTLVSGLPPTTTPLGASAAAPTILNLSKFVNIHHGGPGGGSLRGADGLSFNLGDGTIPPGGGGTTTVGSLLAGMEEERPFKCPYCQKGFKGRENLKLHIRTHTGEKPYNCGVCGKAFGGRSDMNRHLRIHTGEKPYPCKVCGKKFARADYLSKHITTHLGIPFAKPVHSLQQSLQNLENMQNLQNLEKIHNSVNSQSLFSALPNLGVPALQNLQSFQNNLQSSLQSLQNSSVVVPPPPSFPAISPASVIHNKEEIPNLSK